VLSPRATRAVTALPAGQFLLDAIQFGRRPVQSPAVAHKRYQHHKRDPHRPEHSVRAGGQPDHRADHERDQRAPALLHESPLQIATAPGQLRALLRPRDRKLR
jgi:hypothetical protein